jgi:hypothetical protein
MTTLRERIENNLPVFFLATLATGFAAGFATYRAIQEASNIVTIRRADLEQLKRDAAIPDKPDNPQPTPSTAQGDQSATSASTTSVQTVPDNVAEAEGLRVELLGCQLVSDEVRCKFALMSTQSDFTQYLRSSRIISAGQELSATGQQLGESESRGGQVYARLVRNIPVEGTVKYTGLRSKPANGKIDLLELMFDSWPAQFRAVPVQ